MNILTRFKKAGVDYHKNLQDRKPRLPEVLFIKIFPFNSKKLSPSDLCLQTACFQSSSIKFSTFALRTMFLVQFHFSPWEMWPDFVSLNFFLTWRLFSMRKYLIPLLRNLHRKWWCRFSFGKKNRHDILTCGWMPYSQLTV